MATVAAPTTTADAHPLESRGLVEGTRFRCTPVHHELLQILGGQTDAADVPPVAVVLVDPPEAQRRPVVLPQPQVTRGEQVISVRQER